MAEEGGRAEGEGGEEERGEREGEGFFEEGTVGVEREERKEGKKEEDGRLKRDRVPFGFTSPHLQHQPTHTPLPVFRLLLLPSSP